MNNFRFPCNNRKACLQCVDTNCFQFGVNNHVDFVDAALSFDTFHPSNGLDCFVSNDVIYSSKDREWKKINSRHFLL